jgi:hypothetical protein
MRAADADKSAFACQFHNRESVVPIAKSCRDMEASDIDLLRMGGRSIPALGGLRSLAVALCCDRFFLIGGYHG